MVLTDIHNHSAFSADGRSPLEDMVRTAKEKGLGYFGISEHFDFDYMSAKILVRGKEIEYIDARAYFECARALQKKYNDERFTFLAGGEFGFAPEDFCTQRYFEVIERYNPDFVVNSVHTVKGKDCWFPRYFSGKTKQKAYGDYLETVLQSLSAPYPFDIIAHLGYCSRNAVYGDNKMYYSEFADVIDEILKGIIARDKILEVNSSSRGAGSDFLPDADILARYYELGGRAISFASDAHSTERICDKRERVTEALRKIGFTYITVPCRGRRISVQI